MRIIREVIQLALVDYNKNSFMCHKVQDLDIEEDDIRKTLEFIKIQLNYEHTLNGFLKNTVPEYEELCNRYAYKSDQAHAFRVKWWNEVIQIPEAQV